MLFDCISSAVEGSEVASLHFINVKLRSPEVDVFDICCSHCQGASSIRAMIHTHLNNNFKILHFSCSNTTLHSNTIRQALPRDSLDFIRARFRDYITS